MNTDFQAPQDAVVVIGAGVAGLMTAYLLEQQGHSVLLMDSRDRVGGRVLSDAAHTDAPFVDLGPSWVWPEMNDRLHHWTQALGLALFPQFQRGAALVERQHHQVQRFESSFEQAPSSQRWVGGVGALVNALLARLTRTELLLNAQVHRIRHEPTDQVSVAARMPNGDIERVGARVVVTLPPRLLSAQISWEPALPSALTDRWQRTPTWMAGQAKFVAAYPHAFWREAGLSGYAASHVGPLVEIHDASNASGASAALFGFVGVPAQWRAKMGDAELIQRSVQQLAHLFGPQAAEPSWVQLKDWAQDPHTATAADTLPSNGHPTQPPRQLPAPWQGLAYLGGSEFADDFNGYLEGAVRSAEMVANEMKKETVC